MIFSEEGKWLRENARVSTVLALFSVLTKIAGPKHMYGLLMLSSMLDILH